MSTSNICVCHQCKEYVELGKANCLWEGNIDRKDFDTVSPIDILAASILAKFLLKHRCHKIEMISDEDIDTYCQIMHDIKDTEGGFVEYDMTQTRFKLVDSVYDCDVI